jgi:hypothetical protein
MQNSFQAVVDRLIAAMRLPDEQGLAEALGFKRSAFTVRKSRNSLPRDQIDAYIQTHKLNAEWVYEGTGAMFEASRFQKKIDLQNEIHARLDKFALNDRQRSYMAKLLLALELGEPEKLKQHLDATDKLTSDEHELLTGLRSAPSDIVRAFGQIVGFATSKAVRIR